MRSENVFTYGTLMSSRTWASVAGSDYTKVQGAVEGYQRYRVLGEEYPGIVPSPGRVEGVLYLGVAPADVRRLELYEGMMYERRPVTVNLDDGRTIAATAFVVREQFRTRLSAQPWSPPAKDRTAEPERQNAAMPMDEPTEKEPQQPRALPLQD